MSPGVHTDISHQDYLADQDWVTSSMLKRHLPEWFKPFNGSPAADMGSILHQRFTGENIPIRVVDAATWTGQKAKDEYVAAQTAGEYAILERDLIIVDGMEKALRDHREASRLLVDLPGTFETTVCAEVDGVPSKCRFDKLANDYGDRIGIDLKTTNKGPNPFDLARAVIDYGYDLSADHYIDVAEHAGIGLTEFTLVFVSKDPPHHVTVASLDVDFLNRGNTLRELALSRMLHPDFVDPYPGASEPVELACPKWAKL
jgi:hypothetical protein